MVEPRVAHAGKWTEAYFKYAAGPFFEYAARRPARRVSATGGVLGSALSATEAHGRAPERHDVSVFRDAYGVPHIFAPDEARVFETYGYTVAEDRLWQLELNRRAARGRLAEILGARFVEADRLVRLTGYTDAELQAQLERLPAAQQAHIAAYVSGINRYIREVVTPQPKARLPYEFRRLGIAPQPWTSRDTVAFGVFMLRRFGEIGGRELTNEALLVSLIQRFGNAVGANIFNDVLWSNDPGAPTTITAPGKLTPAPAQQRVIPPAQWPTVPSQQPFPSTEQALQRWSEAGVPSRLGSYAWVVHPKKSAEGVAMLYGGPQMGHAVPEVVHEVQLHTEDGLNVTGMAFAGVPYVLIGRNARIAWTSTTAVGDNVDVYRETMCHSDDGAWGTRYRGRCEPALMRRETIEVRDGPAVAVDVWRTVHGPAVLAADQGTAMAQKRAHWQHEIESIVGFYRFGRAQNLHDFEAGVETIVTQHNFLYADVAGNIAYWQAGLVPQRPRGFDFRLPLPGDGTAEWPGKVLPTPTCVNPKQGYLANWNNKPSVGFDSADSHFFGKQSRLSDITNRLDGAKISWQDMRDMPTDIARLEMTGRPTRFLKAYLLHALQKHPPQNPLVQAAARVMQDYDGTMFDDAIGGTHHSVGHAIFSMWVERMQASVFGAVLQDHDHLASIDLLVRALDVAIRGRSSLDMAHRFIDPKQASKLIADAFADAVDVLRQRRGATMQQWQMPRQELALLHPILGRIDTMWGSNRATFAQIVRLDPEGMYGESILTLGQSGHVGWGSADAPVLDAHFKDQLPKFRAFDYKPAVFLFATP